MYEELGKYGDVETQVLCRERIEELEPSIRYCLHKIGASNVQTSELLQIGEMEGPALDLFKAKLEVSFIILSCKPCARISTDVLVAGCHGRSKISTGCILDGVSLAWT